MTLLDSDSILDKLTQFPGFFMTLKLASSKYVQSKVLSLIKDPIDYRTKVHLDYLDIHLQLIPQIWWPDHYKKIRGPLKSIFFIGLKWSLLTAWPLFFIHVSSFWVRICLNTKNQLPKLPGSCCRVKNASSQGGGTHHPTTMRQTLCCCCATIGHNTILLT